MADWTWSTQPSPSVAFLMITSSSRAFLQARTLAPSSFAPSKIFTNLASRSSRMKAGVARNLPGRDHRVATLGSELRRRPLLVAGVFYYWGISCSLDDLDLRLFGASSMVVSATACVASATAASVAYVLFV